MEAQDSWIALFDDGDMNVIDTVVSLHDTPDISARIFEKAFPRLSNQYTGYAIELSESSNFLGRSHRDFIGFGKIFYSKLDKRYQYLILIDFNRKKSIKKYLKQVVLPLQPKARVVRYLNGVRTTVFNWS